MKFSSLGGVMQGLLPWAAFFFLGVQCQDSTFDASPWVGASESCIAALTVPVACNPLLRNLYGGFYNRLSLRALQSICTDECFDSLQEHQRNVSLSCGSTEYLDESTGLSYPATIVDLQSLYAFNQTCLKSGGEFCESYFQNGTEQSRCDDCYLESLQFQLNHALNGQDEDLVHSFTSLTSECSSTQFYTTLPTPVGSRVSTTLPQPTCSGSIYQLQPSDTMYSVSVSQRVSTDTLLNRNGLPDDPHSFPTAGSLCIEDECDVHVVREGDTCESIAYESGINRVQLQSWNSNINSQCTNLNALMNQTLCISNPSGNFTAYINTAVPSPESLTAKFQPPPMTAMSGSKVPYSSYENMFPAPTQKPIPLANGTRSDCADYYYIVSPLHMDCRTWARGFGVNFDQLINWNPSLSDSANEDYSSPTTTQNTCSLATSASYCIALHSTTSTPTVSNAPPPNRATNEIAGCFQWMSTWNNGTCDDLLRRSSLSFGRFYELNPSINDDCSGVVSGVNYCIGSNVYDPNSSRSTLASTSASTTSSTQVVPTGSNMNNTRFEPNSTYGSTVPKRAAPRLF